MRRSIGRSQNRGGQQWDHELVMSDECVTLAAPRRRPHDNVCGRSVLSDEVETHGGEIRESQSLIASQSERLEEHFRQNDRGSAVDVNPVIKVRHIRGEVTEVSETTLSQRRA